MLAAFVFVMLIRIEMRCTSCFVWSLPGHCSEKQNVYPLTKSLRRRGLREREDIFQPCLAASWDPPSREFSDSGGLHHLTSAVGIQSFKQSLSSPFLSSQPREILKTQLILKCSTKISFSRSAVRSTPQGRGSPPWGNFCRPSSQHLFRPKQRLYGITLLLLKRSVSFILPIRAPTPFPTRREMSKFDMAKVQLVLYLLNAVSHFEIHIRTAVAIKYGNQISVRWSYHRIRGAQCQRLSVLSVQHSGLGRWDVKKSLPYYTLKFVLWRCRRYCWPVSLLFFWRFLIVLMVSRFVCVLCLFRQMRAALAASLKARRGMRFIQGWFQVSCTFVRSGTHLSAVR